MPPLRLALLAAVLLGTACDAPTRAASVPSAVRIGQRELTLDEDATGKLDASVLNARGKPVPGARVEWSSSDTSAVRVDSAGTLTARLTGAAWVHASHAAKNGAVLLDSARVTVKAKPNRIGVLNSNRVGRAGAALDPPIRFQVLDSRAKGYAGAEVTFSVASGGGTLSATRALTDSLGYASVVLTFTQPGEVVVEGRVASLSEPARFTARTLARAAGQSGLFPRELVVPVGCVKSIEFRASDLSWNEMRVQVVDFAASDPTVAALALPEQPWFVYPARTLTARKVGITRVAAVWNAGGLTDTATVRVVPRVPVRFTFGAREDSVGIGGRLGRSAAHLDQCGNRVDAGAVTYRSLAPEVVSVGAHGIVGLKPGTARVVAESGRDADTLRVNVADVRILPDGNTVRVGTTWYFQVFRRDATGKLVQLHGFDWSVDSAGADVVSVDWSGWAKALAPGSTMVYGRHWSGLEASARVTVVASAPSASSSLPPPDE